VAETPAVPSPGCRSPERTDGGFRIAVGAERRIVVVRRPAVEEPRGPHPLVIVFHGFGQKAREAERISGVRRLWPEAWAVFPLGEVRAMPLLGGAVGRGWQLEPGELGDRDLAFFDALWEWLRSRYCVDEARVFALGGSNGAFFAELLGCARPQVLAAVAAWAGAMRCRPREPVAVLLGHGRRDELVPFSEAVAAEESWASANGCSGPRLPAAWDCQRRAGCRADVAFCPRDSGHAWDPAFAAAAIEFFRSHPKPAPAGGAR
jgi:polyhydroxybutyrate depolymerase